MKGERLTEILEAIKQHFTDYHIEGFPEIEEDVSLETIDDVARRLSTGEPSKFLKSFFDEHIYAMVNGDKTSYGYIGDKAVTEGKSRGLSIYFVTLIEAYGFFASTEEFKEHFVRAFCSGVQTESRLSELFAVSDQNASLDIALGPKNIAFYCRNPSLVTESANVLLQIEDETLRERASVIIGTLAYGLRENDSLAREREINDCLDLLKKQDTIKQTVELYEESISKERLAIDETV